MTTFLRTLARLAGLAHGLTLGLTLTLGLSTPATAADAPQPRTVTVAQGLIYPWALAFLPDGRLLVTERPGRLRTIDAQGRLSAPIAGLPKVDFAGQCGLLDVVVDPKFAENQRIFWTFAEASADGASNSTAVGRGRLVVDRQGGGRLEDVRVIFSQRPKVASRLHCGSRIAFDKAGHLWVGLGERASEKEAAQRLDKHLGKVVRIDADGKPPADNPFLGTPGALPEIWSLGHRNIQGLATHPITGQLWGIEHGPQGGDELNLLLGGHNYGWPLITYGRNYGSGTRIGEEGPKPGFDQPMKWWVPLSIAPSGMAFVTSPRYPAWQGQLLVGALRGEALLRLTLDGNRVVQEHRHLTQLAQRIRDVRQGPDGYLYVVTDGPEGQVLRLEP